MSDDNADGLRKGDGDGMRVLATVVVALRANGSLSIEGPQDPAWLLAALENAADAVRGRVNREQRLIEVPGRDVDIPASRLLPVQVAK